MNEYIVLTLVSGCTGAPKTAYYQGKTITIVVTSGAGGGTDADARSLAKYLGKYIAGNPRIVVENRAGGGGALAMQYYMTQLPHDGTAIVQTTGGVTKRWLIKAQGHDYDLRKTVLLMSPKESIAWYVGAKIGIKNAKDLVALGRPITAGHQTLDSTQAIEENLIQELLGFKIKQVSGYTSYGETKLAVLKGEVEMSSQGISSWAAEYAPLVKRGEIVPVFQDGIGPEMVRGPQLPDVPTVAEVYKQITGKSPIGKNWDDWRAIVSLQISGPLIVHSDAPPEAIKALRAGIKAMLESDEYKPVALERWGVKNGLDGAIIGDEATKVWNVLFNQPPEIIEIMKTIQ